MKNGGKLEASRGFPAGRILAEGCVTLVLHSSGSGWPSRSYGAKSRRKWTEKPVKEGESGGWQLLWAKPSSAFAKYSLAVLGWLWGALGGLSVALRARRLAVEHPDILRGECKGWVGCGRWAFPGSVLASVIGLREYWRDMFKCPAQFGAVISSESQWTPLVQHTFIWLKCQQQL